MKSLFELLNFQRGDRVISPSNKYIWTVRQAIGSDQVALTLIARKNDYGKWERCSIPIADICGTEGLELFTGILPG